MAHISTNDLLSIFNKLDKNGDGLICLFELNWLLDSIGIQVTMEELESSLEKPSLDFDEFLFFYESLSKQNTTEYEDMNIVYMAFQVFDMNNDGFISCDELKNVLLRLELWDANKSDIDCNSMIRAYDINFDGKLDFEEFKNMMLTSS